MPFTNEKLTNKHVLMKKNICLECAFIRMPESKLEMGLVTYFVCLLKD